MRLGYLTSQYPATSHTFIRREIAALRELDVPVLTYSIRPPSDAELGTEDDRREAEQTYTVLRRGLGEFAAAHLGTLARHPLRYLLTFALSLRHRAPGFKALLLSFAHFAESIVLAARLKRDGITHLHNHFANSAATVGLLSSRLLGLPWSFTMHGISETDYPAGLMLPAKIHAAEMVACVSWFGRAQAMRMVGPDEWSKLQVVRCGLELDRLPQPSNRNHEGIRIICVGRLSPEKGHAGLLEAFSSLRDSREDVHLDLVGDGPDVETLRRLVDRFGLTDKVRFLGRLSEQRTLEEVAASDILVLPSFMEGLPIVLMEAMALGLPVVASRVAGIPELVRDGENGLLFTPSCWPELASAISTLASNPELRARFGAEGRRTVELEFDIRRSAEQLKQLYDKLHGGILPAE